MGGLLSLWFGLSFIDISLVIESILVYINISLKIEILINKIKIIFNHLLIRNIILKILESIKTFLIKLQRYNWKPILTLITFPIILIKIIILFETYLQFSTQIDFDLISYRGIDNKIPINLSPAVMICFKFLYDKVLFHQNNLDYIAMMRDNYSLIDIINRNNINNNNNESNYKIATHVILQSINETGHELFSQNSTKIAYDHVHSIIDFESYDEFKENFELTHNKNILNTFSMIS